jgi:hypothetical protein
MEFDDEGDEIIFFENILIETIAKLHCQIPSYQKLYDGFIMYLDILGKPE